jgi:hypothetical protein
MTTKLDRRAAVALALIGAATIIGLANSASANPSSQSIAKIVVLHQLTAQPAPIAIGPVTIRWANTPVGTTPTPKVVTSNPPSPPKPPTGGQPTSLASLDQGPSPAIVRGGASIETMLPGSVSTGGSQDFIVTATVAQSSDLSTGTFTFDTGDDGTDPAISAAPLVPQTAAEAGLAGVVAPNASGNSAITATVAGAVTAADGSRRVAIDLYGDKLLSFAVDPKTGVKIVSTTESTLASSEKAAGIALGGPVTMLASVARDIVRSTINLAGIRQANGFLMRDGHLVLVFVDKDR